MRRFAHFIDGATREPAADAWLPVMDPARGEAWAEVAAGDARDVDAAVTAASTAFPA
ncbi:MAG: aldehyde dehydrogenase family protein, partial [Gammaproteobacteria bacterium]|nr:aldehyde dehydrogenase family protein [Gammaproteobacteria bacterium]